VPRRVKRVDVHAVPAAPLHGTTSPPAGVRHRKRSAMWPVHYVKRSRLSGRQ
jgi:hypothetical protein